jgi:hypothetical protein
MRTWWVKEKGGGGAHRECDTQLECHTGERADRGAQMDSAPVSSADDAW